MRKFFLCLLLAGFIGIPGRSQVVLKVSKPLSTEDKDAVLKILSEFDPNSYKFSGTYLDANKTVRSFRSGTAVGLTKIKQTNSKIINKGTAASTNTNNNIFKTASTNTNNNIFRAASTNTNNNIFKAASTNTNNNIFKAASTNTNNNIFKSGPDLDNKLNQLYTILSKYQ